MDDEYSTEALFASYEETIDLTEDNFSELPAFPADEPPRDDDEPPRDDDEPLRADGEARITLQLVREALTIVVRAHLDCFSHI